jgi:hypothetical protein
MNDSERVNPGHTNIRAVLRMVGPLVAGIGLVLIVVGVASFFRAFGGFEPPKYFWCAFAGIPLLGVGIAICKFAFMGPVVRYMAAETAPVAKDTFNYVAEGTQPGVRKVASAVAEGLSAAGRQTAAGLECAACGQLNDADARFCDNCGATLA